VGREPVRRTGTGADLEVMDGDNRSGGADAGDRGADQALDDAALEQRARDRATARSGDCGAAADRSGEHRLLQRERRGDREQHAQLAALAVDLGTELAAARAFAQMPAEVGAPKRATVQIRELFADLGAIRLPGGTAGDE
jgi:hypothetical protein